MSYLIALDEAEQELLSGEIFTLHNIRIVEALPKDKPLTEERRRNSRSPKKWGGRPWRK